MDAKEILITCSLAFLLTGCGSSEKICYVDKPVYVNVPVVQKVEIEMPKKPVYHIKNIKADTPPAKIAENYVNTIKELNAYIEKLERLLEPFVKKKVQ